MKSLLIAFSILSAAPAFAAYSGDYDQRSPRDFISWCDKNQVMMVQNDEIVVVRNCTETEQTCRVVEVYSNFGSQVTASCR
ncbi:hypothetical protein [Bdellovibrio sp. HCB209]|uniref:hypothetical protein n=1 Tax=Bdellovibrio sp. HCB209 TaxID=3394354 RepID=UPI0039B37942